MIKESKIISEWDKNPPPLTRWEEVRRVLKRLDFKIYSKRGSAIRVEHEKLSELDPASFGDIGGFTIYKTHAKGGPKDMICKRYLGRVVYAAKLILGSDYLTEDHGEDES
ncbi:hypothetical protein KKG05_01355 [bacterium]|nr:hypothetical protein [bacterium]